MMKRSTQAPPVVDGDALPAPTLLTVLVKALVKADGDAVVLDSGSVPYVIADGGETSLETGIPAIEDVEGSVAELLPADLRGSLERLGAVRYELPPMPALLSDQLTLVVVRLDMSLWVEIRRNRPAHRRDVPAVQTAEEQPQLGEESHDDISGDENLSKRHFLAMTLDESGLESAGPAGVVGLADQVDRPAVAAASDVERPAQSAASALSGAIASALRESAAIGGRIIAIGPQLMRLGRALILVIGRGLRSAYLVVARYRDALVVSVSRKDRESPPDRLPAPTGAEGQRRPASDLRQPAPHPPVVDASAESLQFEWANLSSEAWAEAIETSSRVDRVDAVEAVPESRVTHGDALSLPSASELWAVGPASVDPDGDLELGDVFGEPVGDTRPPAAAAKSAVHVVRDDRGPGPEVPERPPAIVLAPGLDRLLQMGVARRATTLHLMSQASPAIRVDGGMQFLDGELPLSADELDALLMPAMPEAMQSMMRKGGRVEWISEVPGVGRVLCSSFRDHRGVTAIFGLSAVYRCTAEDLGLSAEVQALALEPEGLILVTGARSSGKHQVMTAFIDLANRLRRDYIITLEHEIRVVHEPQGSVINQREVRGGEEEWPLAVRAALEDDPDVLAIDDMRADSVIRLALKAAGQGHLVIAGLPARTATAAIDSILGAHGAEDRRRAQTLLSEHLCGVVTQTMLRQPVGEGLIAREVLLNTPTVAKLIAAGRTSELSAAIEEGRSAGMVSLNDRLLELVRNNAVDIHEAYRGAGDRAAFLDMLQREGIDTSVFEPPRA